MDSLKNRVEFNQLIKDKINEKITKRKTLKQELLRLNTCRIKIECQMNEQHQKLYLLGLDLNDAEYNDKVNKLCDTKKIEVNRSRAKIDEVRQELKVVIEDIKRTFNEYNKLI